MRGSRFARRMTPAKRSINHQKQWLTVIFRGVIVGSVFTDVLLDRLLAAIETLETFPLRGSVPRELDALGIREFRQILVEPYRLIYRVVGKTVFVMVIADGRRDMQALLERRLLGS